MVRNFCIVCLLSCAVAAGQSLLTASIAESRAAIPTPSHTLSRTASIPQFNAASLRIAAIRNQQVNAVSAYPDRTITCAHCTLQFLATLAFGLQDWQVNGTSEWMSDAPFDLDASTSDRSQPAIWNSQMPLSDGQRQMLRALLIDRFRLSVHRETRTDTVYLLQRSGQQLGLATASHPWEAHLVSGAGGGSIGGATGIAGKNISMHELASRISSVLKRPVIDQTGLSGTFDFACCPGDVPGGDASDTVFDSMREVGLKLTAVTGTVETLVIDHAEPPPENSSTIYTRDPDCHTACTKIVEDTNPRP